MEIQTARLDATFAALSDPTRRAILARLARGAATVSELSQPFALSQPTISKHLKVLETAGLIETGRDAQRRPRKLKEEGIRAVDAWIEPFRRNWAQRFDNLERHLARSPQEK